MLESALSKRWHRADQWIGIFCLVFGSMWIVALYVIAQGDMPYNAADLDHPASRRTLEAFVPQGWGFFTRDAREERTLAFRGRRGEWSPALTLPLSRPENAFGLDRSPRADSHELNALKTLVPDTAWRSCRDALDVCLNAPGARMRVHDPAPSPALCGALQVVLQPPVPWAWSKWASTTHMPMRVASLEVEC